MYKRQVPEYQGKGYAKALIDFIVKEYADNYSVLQVGTGDSPVSYTHLDVYKRQNLHRKNVNCAIMPQFVGLRINMISVIIDKGVYVYTFVFFAVSYTHLDVYKRQVCI